MISKKKTFTRQELYDLVWSKPLTTIAKEFDISYSVIKNIYKKNNIPCPDSGYWSKIKFNKEVCKIPLPKSTELNEISLSQNKGRETITLEFLSEKQQLKKGIESDLKSFLKVPDKLTKPHRFIVEARKNINNQKPSTRNNVQGLTCTTKGFFDIKVFKENINRALRFSNALIKLFIERGHKIEISSDKTILTIHGETYEVCVRELRKREETNDWYGFKWVSTGVLTLRISKDWRKSIIEWKDSKKSPIEKKLPQILIDFELLAKNDRENRIKMELSWAENERKRKNEEELNKRKEKELENVKSLIQNSELWKKAFDLRNYIKKIEANAAKNNSLTEELKNWIIWANKKADWYDPLTEIDDELLADVDKEKLELKKVYWWQ